MSRQEFNLEPELVQPPLKAAVITWLAMLVGVILASAAI